MRHLILCREYPPAPYLPGGIGTYVTNIARLLAEAGEIVTVIGQQWSGASREREDFHDGRLIVRRVPIEAPVAFESASTRRASTLHEIELFRDSPFPHQAFSWNAALLAETLIETEGVDVVEGQEWEAPLYYLLLRRAIGLGPSQRPPCLVHLHSPTLMIVRHNEWSLAHPAYLAMVRCEDYVVRSADGLLCASRFLADQVAETFGVDRDSIRVLPYPTGDLSIVERPLHVWNSHALIYVGRLEPRKGLIEWIDAAVDMAREFATARFDLIGGDVPYRAGLSVAEYLHRRIPPEFRSRFVFHGVKPRSELRALLADARAAVVPSRWENFPNSCIEAMCSGLPVVASPQGGMIEMICDGDTGWIAKSGGAADLADAMRRALSTDGVTCARMGLRAAESIRHLCDNDSVTAQHIAFRRALVKAGPSRSRGVRTALRAGRAANPAPPPSSARRRDPRIAVVVDAMDDVAGIESTVAGVLAQDRGRVDCAIVVGQEVLATRTVRQAEACGCRIVAAGEATRLRTIRETASTLVASEDVIGVALLPSTIAPLPDFARTIGAILEACQPAGAVSPWVASLPATLGPCPSFPYAWILDEASPATVFRREAFLEARWFEEDVGSALLRWALTLSLLADGWAIVTAPAVLASARGFSPIEPVNSPREVDVRRRLRARFAPLVAQHGNDVISLLEEGIGMPRDHGWPWLQAHGNHGNGAGTARRLSLRDVLRMPAVEKLRLMARGVRHPVRAGAWVGSKARHLGRRFGTE